MNQLKVALPSGSTRYITGIYNNDFSHSIYDCKAIEATQKNIDRANKVLTALGLTSVEVVK